MVDVSIIVDSKDDDHDKISLLYGEDRGENTRCHPLKGVTLVEDLICEPHHLSGSLKEDREKLMEVMKNFVDTNALVTI